VKVRPWPTGGGEMACLVREHDWAETPLGPIEGWPQGLRALVDLVLASETVTCLMWGEQAIAVYNDAYASALGARHPGALGRSAFETWADVRPVFEPLFERAFRAGETVAERDLRFSFSGGVPSEETYFDLTYSPVPDERGNVIGVLATLSETTDRVLAERELADTKATLEDSEARYRAFVTASSDVVYRMGPDWAEMRRLDGRGFISDTAEPTEAWMERYIHHDDRPLVGAAIDEAVRTKGIFELEHRVVRVDGTLGWTLSRAVPILGTGGEVVEWLGTASDVTAHREAEEAQRESEERQAFLLELSDALQPLADLVEIQKVAARLLGEQLGVNRVSYGEIEGAEVVMRGSYAQGVAPIPERFPHVTFGRTLFDSYPDGGTIAVNDVATDARITDDELAAYRATEVAAYIGMKLEKAGRWVATFGVHSAVPRDWTDEEIALVEEVAERTWAAVERAHAEEALRESEDQYRTLFSSIDEGFCTIEVIFDERGTAVDYRFLETNRAFERQTGLDNATGKTVRELAPEHEEFWFEIYGRIARTGEAMRFEHEAAALGRFYDVYAFRIGEPKENRVAVIFNDVLARKLAEEERERLRALEASARAEEAERERISRELHDRVAHHMGVAHQSLELFAALRKDVPARAEERLGLAREYTRLAFDQTRALSAELKRLQEEELQDGLGSAFRALAGTTVPDATEVDVSVSGKESEVPNAIAMQVYLAMREAIRNAVKHSGCSRIGVTLDVRDGEVVGSVEDDGEGFDSEAVGEATPSWGVGLGSMRERAEMLGGSYRIDSKPGAGTRVELRVPLDGRP
jgi:PAS domain S-box-containing protein